MAEYRKNEKEQKFLTDPTLRLENTARGPSRFLLPRRRLLFRPETLLQRAIENDNLIREEAGNYASR